MVNTIIESIAAAIHEEYGAYNIYVENIPQEFATPAFFIQLISEDHRHFRGTRYYSENHFAIQFFPQQGRTEVHDCHLMADSLKWVLETIEYTGDKSLIRGTNMSYAIDEGVLNFLISYNLFLDRTSEEDPMETISEDQRAR